MKRFFLLAISILCFVNITECNRLDPDSLESFNDRPCPLGKRLDFLIQFASVMSLNSKNHLLIKGLAASRIFMNHIQVIQRMLCCFDEKKPEDLWKNMLHAFTNSDASKMLELSIASARLYNIFRDVKIFRASKSLADIKARKISSKKKVMLAVWLVLNKMALITIREIIQAIREYDLKTAFYGPIYLVLGEASELYRQNVMYSLISKKIRPERKEIAHK